MSNRFLVEQFERWRATGDDLVLATVIETGGSTYSKAGRQLLINGDRRYAGLVGGGCLEGDLVLRAEEVLRTGQAQLVSYDMRDDADDLWGIGLGCRGMMRLLLQALNQDSHWQPFPQLAEVMSSNAATAVSLVIASENEQHPAGQLSICNETDLSAPAAIVMHENAAGNFESLRWTSKPWPRLLLLGAGPDSHPVAGMARLLGWQVCVADHRPALLEASELDAADSTVLVDSNKLGEQLDLQQFSAACIMSHHLETDCNYVRALSQQQLTYTGVLGPTARREEILRKLQLQQSEFAARLRGPVGLDIGADTPQTIALALLAEIAAAISANELQQA